MAWTISALALFVYLVGTRSGVLLAGVAWTRRRPALAVASWAALVTAFLFVLSLLTLMLLAWPSGPVHAWIEHFHDCVPGHTHTGEIVAIAVVVLVSALLLRVSYRGLARAGKTYAGRRRHHLSVMLVATYPEQPRDVCLIDHPAPVVYCLPRRRRPIVMTTGALAELSPAQAEAVLAHERTHLRHHHHGLLAVVDALRVAFPWATTIAQAQSELSELIELAADDAAALRCGPAPVIDALRQLTPSPLGPEPGTGLEQRIARLEGRAASRNSPPRAALALLGTACGVLVTAVAVQLSC
ncbi:M48 family metalloprotease [Nonomuraea sp. M3C6]|uniref:M48 family metalloprotease n=1 Tax=Nonomuraea marmarensis TaxID=3351344 RepID=A0ABW7A7X3_9ACTN